MAMEVREPGRLIVAYNDPVEPRLIAAGMGINLADNYRAFLHSSGITGDKPHLAAEPL